MNTKDIRGGRVKKKMNTKTCVKYYRGKFKHVFERTTCIKIIVLKTIGVYRSATNQQDNVPIPI